MAPKSATKLVPQQSTSMAKSGSVPAAPVGSTPKKKSTFIKKEDLDLQIKATRIENAMSVLELAALAEAGDVKEMYMDGVDVGDPANLGKFDINFCSAIQKCRGVQAVGVTYGQMEPGSAHRFATAVSHHGTLRRLYLRGNSIKMQGVNLMVQQLQGNTILQVLELDENGIGPAFPMGILEALPNLQKLNLYGNEIRTFPQELVDRPNTQLEDLDLRANGMKKSEIPSVLPVRWMVNDQRDEDTLKKLKIRRRVTLY